MGERNPEAPKWGPHKYMHKRTKKLRNDALVHYDRIIAYGENQSEDDKPSAKTMKKDIGVNWMSKYCSYCLDAVGECDICAITFLCGTSPWMNMERAKTWRDWVIKAKIHRKWIKKNG